MAEKGMKVVIRSRKKLSRKNKNPFELREDEEIYLFWGITNIT